MGTSGAYGGSGASDWGQVHGEYDAAAQSGPAGPAKVDKLAAAISAALSRANPPSSLATAYSAPALGLGRRAVGSGYTSSRTAGSTRGGSTGFGRRAARGAKTLAGAQAYWSRDSQALTELGLDLDFLDGLPSDRARCSSIADTLLGMPAHPDDAALKSASIATMSEVFKSETEMDSDQLLAIFIENLTYEQVLVELTSQQRKTRVANDRAARIEKNIKKYIRSSLEASKNRRKTGSQQPNARRFDARAMVNRAGELAAKVLRIFGGSHE